jgi:hypothetical protein
MSNCCIESGSGCHRLCACVKDSPLELQREGQTRRRAGVEKAVRWPIEK